MVKAVWKDTVIAQSRDTIVVEGNHYFPMDSVNMQYLIPSASHTRCPWKGIASYYSPQVDGSINQDAAWYYPHPSQAAGLIKGYIAFWRGVQVIVSPEKDVNHSLAEIQL